MAQLYNIYAFVFGAMIGSYLNVLILRLPEKQDTVKKSSHCPKCKKEIKWYMNIPIVSYAFLMGKCAFCKTKISIQYPIVELVTGITAFYLFPEVLNVTTLLDFAVLFSIACCFICHFVIDLRTQLLLDKINIYLAIIIFFYSLYLFPYSHWILGGVIGFGFPFIVTWLFYKIRGQIGLGGGDIKLFGILGLYLGPIGIINNIFLSCFVGALIGTLLIVSKKLSRETPMPFGPFIIITASFQIFFPDYYGQLVRYLFS